MFNQNVILSTYVHLFNNVVLAHAIIAYLIILTGFLFYPGVI